MGGVLWTYTTHLYYKKANMFDRKQYKRELKKLYKRGSLQHRRTSSCGKVSYESLEEALVVASTRLKIPTADTNYLRPYLHEDCGEWHLTSKEPF